MYSRIPFALAALLFAWTALAAPPSDRDPADLEIPLQNWLPALLEPARQDSTNSEGEITTMALPSEASHFIAIAPCRVVDTRRPDGLHGGPILTGGVPSPAPRPPPPPSTAPASWASPPRSPSARTGSG